MGRLPMFLSRSQRHRQRKKVRIWFSGFRSMAGFEDEDNDSACSAKVSCLAEIDENDSACSAMNVSCHAECLVRSAVIDDSDSACSANESCPAEIEDNDSACSANVSCPAEIEDNDSACSANVMHPRQQREYTGVLTYSR